MELVRELIEPYLVEWLLAIVIVQLLFGICIIATWVKFRKIRKQQKYLLRGMTRDTLEQLISRYTQSLERAEKQVDQAAVELDIIKRHVETMTGRLGIVRYNALTEQGSNLSFSLAMLDQEQTGVVITSLYGRNQAYTYAKPVTKGQSSYPLSEEEKEAISRASSPSRDTAEHEDALFKV